MIMGKPKMIGMVKSIPQSKPDRKLNKFGGKHGKKKKA